MSLAYSDIPCFAYNIIFVSKRFFPQFYNAFNVARRNKVIEMLIDFFLNWNLTNVFFYSILIRSDLLKRVVDWM